MYAVLRSGNKQLRVQPGDVVAIEKVAGDPGQQVELREVLMVGGEAASDLRVGEPLVAGVVVRATVQGEVKGPKIRIFKYKRRKRYRLRRGHRQHYTQIRIDAIEG
jgi:large subunit ribosomal protein L21